MPITVLDPTAEVVTPAGGMAPPLRSLAGKTIGLLDNGKVNVGVSSTTSRRSSARSTALPPSSDGIPSPWYRTR